MGVVGQGWVNMRGYVGHGTAASYTNNNDAHTYIYTQDIKTPTQTETHVEEGVEREGAQGEALHGAGLAPELHVVLDGQHVEEHVQARHLGCQVGVRVI